MTQVPGPLMFVRYAYPPNALGYCGPADFAAFREYAVAGVVDRGLVQLAQAFAGAWPYLELIAAGCGIDDPLDRRVVEAYWVGNDLLDKVPVSEIGDSMQDRFRHRAGSNFPFLAEGVLAGGVPRWDWICDRLTRRQLRALRGFTLRHLDLVNHRVEHPGTLAVLG
jgi:hypothetical protein